MKRTTTVLAVSAVVAVSAGVWFGIRQKPVQSKSNSVTKTTKAPTQTPESSTVVPVFDKKQYSTEDPTSVWVVVNKQRPLNPKTYAPSDLTNTGSGQSMRAEAAQAYQQLVVAAKTAGFTLIPESGYRSYNTQVSVYGNEVKNYGQATADTESARPGYSEHQTGWAIDIGTPGCLEDCFGNTEAAKWVLANAATYGFIQRYAPNKSDVTGYRHEPWHFRYVSKPLAQEIVKSGQTLEEFFGLPAAPNY